LAIFRLRDTTQADEATYRSNHKKADHLGHSFF
jgi:hypothetical protein